MKYEIGKIIEYDNYIGIIKTINKKYIFLSHNAESNLKENDLVKFKPNQKEENIAHHVKKISKNIKR